MTHNNTTDDPTANLTLSTASLASRSAMLAALGHTLAAPLAPVSTPIGALYAARCTTCNHVLAIARNTGAHMPATLFTRRCTGLAATATAQLTASASSNLSPSLAPVKHASPIAAYTRAAPLAVPLPLVHFGAASGRAYTLPTIFNAPYGYNETIRLQLVQTIPDRIAPCGLVCSMGVYLEARHDRQHYNTLALAASVHTRYACLHDHTAPYALTAIEEVEQHAPRLLAAIYQLVCIATLLHYRRKHSLT